MFGDKRIDFLLCYYGGIIGQKVSRDEFKEESIINMVNQELWKKGNSLSEKEFKDNLKDLVMGGEFVKSVYN